MPAETLIKMAAGRCTFVTGHASNREMHKSACWQIGYYNSAADYSISRVKPLDYGGVLGGRGEEIYAHRS